MHDPPLLYDGQMFNERQMKDYARANVAHATATLQTEIEKLRAEVEGLHEQLRLAIVDQVNAEAEANDARAEVKALRDALEELISWIPSAATYRRLGFDPEAPMRAYEEAKAALSKEVTR